MRGTQIESDYRESAWPIRSPRLERGVEFYNQSTMEASHFDEHAFFSAVDASGVRAPLIGRRALVLLGLPLLTADYDYWIAIDDIERFNEVAAGFGLTPTRSVPDARRSGRYALENDEHVDVLVARSVPALNGPAVVFEELLISSRPKDLEDIRLLRILKEEQR